MKHEAIIKICEKKADCIVVKDNAIIYSASGKGIKPLLNVYSENPEYLINSFVADKVIGKAAAMILCIAKVKEVYAERMSEKALELLEKHHINASYKEKVTYIQNMDRTDMCPLEKTVKDIEKLEVGMQEIIRFVEKMKK